MSLAAAPTAGRFDGTPTAPACTDRGGPHTRPWPGGGSGDTTRSACSCLGKEGLGATAPPQGPPAPHRPAAQRRRNRPTPRPDREPSLTGLSFRGDEPAAFEWPRHRERMSI